LRVLVIWIMQYCLFFMYLYLLFFLCTYLFSTLNYNPQVFVLSRFYISSIFLLTFYTLLKHFLTTPNSIKFNPVLCVHRHALFICRFTSPCSVFVCFSNCVYSISNNCLFNTMQKVIIWLDDCYGPSPILCDTVTFMSTLINYFAIVFIYSDFYSGIPEHR